MGASRTAIRLGFGALASLAALLALSTAAPGFIVGLYSNSFQSRSDVREIDRLAGGRACAGGWRERVEQLKVVARRGPVGCAYSIPVSGDGQAPNHQLMATAKLMRRVPPENRESAFLSLRIRAGKGTFYALHVYPRTRTYEVLREPEGDGFPVVGRDRGINGFKRGNLLTLRAIGPNVVAKVNRKRMAKVTDPDPDAVTGGRLAFGVGQDARTRDATPAIYGRALLKCPNAGC